MAKGQHLTFTFNDCVGSPLVTSIFSWHQVILWNLFWFCKTQFPPRLCSGEQQMYPKLFGRNKEKRVFTLKNSHLFKTKLGKRVREGKNGCWVHGVGKNSLYLLVRGRWSPGAWRNLLWVSGRGCGDSGDSSSRITYWMCWPSGVCLDVPWGNWSPHREPLAKDVPPMGTFCSSMRPVPHGSIWDGPEMWWENKMACFPIPAAYGAWSQLLSYQAI